MNLALAALVAAGAALFASAPAFAQGTEIRIGGRVRMDAVGQR